MWIADHSTPHFEKTIMKLWSDIKPLYTQLHAYVRRKLRTYYGSRLISENGTIPAHLLGKELEKFKFGKNYCLFTPRKKFF